MTIESVIKRNGKKVPYDSDKIKNAMKAAFNSTVTGFNEEDFSKVGNEVINALMTIGPVVSIEDIQNTVEYVLMKSNRPDVAKAYIIYRYEKTKKRKRANKDTRLISDEFISKYKHLETNMNQLGNFVYYRTYSRWLPEEHRREFWWETVRRAVEYNCSLVETSIEEAEKLFDNIFNLRQFLSGRTLWAGSTKVAKEYPMSNYNCSFQIINRFKSFEDVFYLLMIGSGAGTRILKDDVKDIEKFRTDYELVNVEYTPVRRKEREDSTGIEFFFNNTVEIKIGDSKEGWVQALGTFLKLISSSEYKNVKTILMNYNYVRPKGEKLNTFGGTASGHISLKNMFDKINSVLQKVPIRDGMDSKGRSKLKPIDCLDIVNIIGENVVIGGVRRTSEIVLMDSDDIDSIEAKSKLYTQNDSGSWEINNDIIHRQISNNSIYFKEKPSREELHNIMVSMRYSGEPGWVNAEAASKRRDNFNGVNPCGEILLDDKGLCNLTTINVMAFVKTDNDGITTLDIKSLLEAQRLSARSGYRMTCVELELPEWDKVQSRDRLIGCSLTGWQDMVNACNLTIEDQRIILRELRKVAKDEAEKIANQLGTPVPLLVTTVKPEGTLSQLPTVSSGVHYSHSPYFVRRVRISADDPLLKVCEKLDYPIFPENGQTEDNCTVKVVEFPVKAPAGKTKYDVSAITQLNNYIMFMEEYVDHNCSITISVRDHEWDEVEKFVWDNWDEIVAVTFLSLDDNFYNLQPYEAITEEEYIKRKESMKQFVPALISEFEKEEVELDVGADSCSTGACPIR